MRHPEVPRKCALVNTQGTGHAGRISEEKRFVKQSRLDLKGLILGKAPLAEPAEYAKGIFKA
jgi:hypothetical protein